MEDPAASHFIFLFSFILLCRNNFHTVKLIVEHANLTLKIKDHRRVILGYSVQEVESLNFCIVSAQVLEIARNYIIPWK